MTWLAARDLKVELEGWTVLDGFSLDLERDRPLALVGPSGCGKTTFLRVLAGLVRASSGTVFLEGEPIDALPPEKRGFGLMFQDYALFPHMSVLDNVAFGPLMKGESRAEAARRARPWLDRFGLADKAGHSPEQLSGGQRQRVALARLLAAKPRLLLLDEPFSAVDAELRQQLAQDLAAVLEEVPAVYVTHDLTEALALTRDLALMDAGRLIAQDEARRLWRRPPNLRAARFLGFNILNSVDLPQIPAGEFWALSPRSARLEAGGDGVPLNFQPGRQVLAPEGFKLFGLWPSGAPGRFDFSDYPPEENVALYASPESFLRFPQP